MAILLIGNLYSSFTVGVQTIIWQDDNIDITIWLDDNIDITIWLDENIDIIQPDRNMDVVIQADGNINVIIQPDRKSGGTGQKSPILSGLIGPDAARCAHSKLPH